MDINLLKDLAHLRLAIAYRQFDENKKSVEEFENIIKQTPDLRCKALAYIGKMISYIKMKRDNEEWTSELEDKVNKLNSKYEEYIKKMEARKEKEKEKSEAEGNEEKEKYTAEDYFMKFYAARFDIEVLGKKLPRTNKRIRDIIINAAIPIHSQSATGKLILENIIANVPTEWSPDVLANFWEVLAISYIYQNEGNKKEIDICFENARFHAKKMKSNFDSPRIFSEYELKDIHVSRFIDELKPDIWLQLLENANNNHS